jgi:frataxin-like iron-binding protein CyaY
MLRSVLAGGRRAIPASLRSTSRLREVLNAEDSSSAAAAIFCQGSASCYEEAAAPFHNPLPQIRCRKFSTDFPMLGVDPDTFESTSADGQEHISEQRFHRAADVTLGELLQKLDGYLGDQPQPGTSVDMTEGRLQVQLGQDRGLVISKDPEARQLHTSGFHGDASYALAADPEDGRWVSVEGGRDLHEVLEQEIKEAIGKGVDLEPEDRHGYGPDPT